MSINVYKIQTIFERVRRVFIAVNPKLQVRQFPEKHLAITEDLERTFKSSR